MVNALVFALLAAAMLGASSGQDVIFGDYGLTYTINGGTTQAILQTMQGATQLLGNFIFVDQYCTSSSVVNKSDALVQTFSKVREIHGYLQLSVASCVSDFSFFKSLIYIRGITRQPISGFQTSLYIFHLTNPTQLREIGLTSLALVNGTILVQGSVGSGQVGICGKGNIFRGFQGVDLPALVPGTTLSDTMAAVNTTRLVVKSLYSQNLSISYTFDLANGTNYPYCGANFCHSSCNGRCWNRNNPNACQKATCNTSCTTGCVANSPDVCCPASCAIGCNSTGYCDVCAPGYLRNPDGTCQLSCPSGYLQFGYNFANVGSYCNSSQTIKVFSPFTCLPSCPTESFASNGTCVSFCPGGALPVNGVCPTNYTSRGIVCTGVDIVDSGCELQILQDQNCEVLTGSIQVSKTLYSSITPALIRNALGKLRVITGSLYIFQSSWFNLGFLSSLESIDGNPGTSLVTTKPTLYIVQNYVMTTLGLSNLRSLGGTNIYIQNNRYMCLQDTIDWLSMVSPSARATFTMNLNFTSSFLASADAQPLALASLPPLSTWTIYETHPTLCTFVTCSSVCGPRRGCWDVTSDSCQRCPSGSFLLNGTCIATCPAGTFVGSLDAFSDPTGTYACVACDSSCSTCNGAAKTNCLTCPSGLAVLPDGTCGYCDVVADGYLLNGSCTHTCPPGMWADPDTVKCLPCDSNCSRCSGGSTLCTACNPNSFLSSSVCYSTCPAGQYGIASSWTCVGCSQECHSCLGPGANNCTSCATQNGYFSILNTTTCVSASGCPSKTFANIDNFECDACVSSCLACVYRNHTSACLNCMGPTYLGGDGICHPITTCTSAQFQVSPPTLVTDRECAAVTVCDGGQYQTVASTATTDRTCKQGTVCNTTQYEFVLLTLTSDRSCKDCSNCTRTNETLLRACNGIDDAVCQARPLCDSNPCANNGTCINNQGWSTSCVCGSNFGGPTCTIDYRVCSPNPEVPAECACINCSHRCLHNGTCAAQAGGSYTCGCNANYSGPICNIDLRVCNPSPCLNNATCTAFVNGDFSCTCSAGWTGVLCGTSTATQSSSSLLSSVGTAVGSVIGLIVLLIFLLLVIRHAHRMRRKRAEQRALEEGLAEPEGPLLGDKWEIDPKLLIIGKILGEGQFGQVNQGLYKQPNGAPAMDVAIKTMKEDAGASDRADFITEISLMKDIGRHPHVLSLVGVCSQEPRKLVIEFAEKGDLRSYMLERRATPSRPALLLPEDMLDFSLQIAHGMEYLASLRIIHRDLATRNVLVAKIDGVLLLKVSDFGLARDVYEENFYKKTTIGKIPFKWMSPESLEDAVYTTQSDVWSFGIVMWEIYMLGAVPYPSIEPGKLLDLLKRGYRMPCPPMCVPACSEIMMSCWQWMPEARPTFTGLRIQLAILAGRSDQYEHPHAGIPYYMTEGVMNNTGYMELNPTPYEIGPVSTASDAGRSSVYDNEGAKPSQSAYDNEGNKSLYDNEQKPVYDSAGNRSLYDNEAMYDKAGNKSLYDNEPSYDKAGKGAAEKSLYDNQTAARDGDDKLLYDNQEAQPAGKGRRESAYSLARDPEDDEQPRYDMTNNHGGKKGEQPVYDHSAASYVDPSVVYHVAQAGPVKGSRPGSNAYALGAANDDRPLYDMASEQPKRAPKAVVQPDADMMVVNPAVRLVITPPADGPNMGPNFGFEEEDPTMLTRGDSIRSGESDT